MANKKAFYQVNEYLSLWKKALDDEVLNEGLRNKIKKESPYKKILDIGTGSGTQIRRNIEDRLITNEGLIIGIDVNSDGLRNSKSDFEFWSKENGWKIEFLKNDKNAILEFNVVKKGFNCLVKLYSISVYELENYVSLIGNDFELVTALSLFEHTDIEKALKGVVNLMKKGSYLYAPINYNGITKVRPLPNNLTENQDNNLMNLFNEVLIKTQNVGGVDIGESWCGNVMPIIAKKLGFKIIGVADSNWLITGNSNSYQRAAYKMFIDAIKDELLSLKDKDKIRVKNKLGVTNEQIEIWYQFALQNFENKSGTFFCANKDILIQK
jgi:SAM-dependent methyltransferase